MEVLYFTSLNMMFKPIMYVGDKKKNSQPQITKTESPIQYINSSKINPFQTSPSMNVMNMDYSEPIGNTETV